MEPYERAWRDFSAEAAKDLWKEPLPVRAAKGVISVGAGALICAGFGLMLLSMPSKDPMRRRRSFWRL
ncbi:MAG: hypothetical protein VXX11_03485 [Planctomycetota bacterium]|nr:hypothetical protein [Planctomycetota bacterium]